MAICEWCGKEHDGTYGSGRFCSYTCKQEYCKHKGTIGNPKQLETRICERCGKEFTVPKRSKKRFCSYSCANVRIHTEETKQKISNGVRLNNKSKGNISKRDLGKLYNYKTPEELPDLDVKIHVCKICGKQFYHVFDRDTCNNPKCRKAYNKQVQLDHWEKSPRDRYRTDGDWNTLAFQHEYKYYYTYKITNLINGKYYYGMHMTNNLNDGYMGSGRGIKKAIKKHGRDNFKKEILEYYDCYADLSNAERLLISEDVINDHNCYNQKPGGCGGPAFLGKKHTKETKDKIRDKILQRCKNN